MLTFAEYPKARCGRFLAIVLLLVCAFALNAQTAFTTPATLPNAFVNTPYEQTLAATGGTSPYSFAQGGGSWPAGIYLEGDTLTGTPTTTGTYYPEVWVFDSGGGYDFRTFTLHVVDQGTSSIAPASGTGMNRTFNVTYSLPGGLDSSGLHLRFINSTGDPNSAANACAVSYDPAHNRVTLLDDAGNPSLSSPLGVGMLQNSQCMIDLPNSTTLLGTTYATWTATITFKPAFAGASPKNVFIGPPGSWQQIGTWTVGSAALQTGPVTPASGSGTSQVFTAAFTDGNGIGDVTALIFTLKNQPGLTNWGPCTIQYIPGGGSFVLLDGTGGSMIPLPRNSGWKQNDSCVVDTSGLSANTSGNTITLTIPLSFNYSFRGSWNTYLQILAFRGQTAVELQGSYKVTAAAANLFAAATSLAGPVTPTSVATGDFDGSGNIGVAVAGASNLQVLPGKGNGTFQTATSLSLAGGTHSIAAGDFNHDGKLDLAVTTDASNKLSVLLGNGASGSVGFHTPVDYTVGASPRSVLIADLNGDGNLDLAAVNAADGTVSVLLGNGDGSFQAAKPYPAAANALSLAAGDFNGDGRPDLAVAGGGTVSVLLGNGDGTFQTAVQYTAGSDLRSIAVADFNSDGADDLAVSDNASGHVSLLLNNGDGTFSASSGPAVGAGVTKLRAGDFNGDGKADLVAVNDQTNTVALLAGNGNATFQPAVDYVTGTSNGSTAIAVGDFNGDGRADLAIASGDSTLTSLLGVNATFATAGGTPQSGYLGTAFAAPLQVKVTDQASNPVSGVTVIFTAPSTGATATLSSSTAVTNASGIAGVTATANSTIGNYTVTAAAGSLTAPFSLTNVADAPASMTATGGTPQSATVGTAFAAPLQVQVLGNSGSPISGITVSFSAPANGASATLSSGTALTDASGYAGVTATANNTGGPYTVTASAGSLAATFSLANADFTVSAAPSSQTVTAGGNTTYTVTTTAANGFNGAVTFSASGLPAGATPTFDPNPVTGAGTTTLTVATASTTAPGTYTVTVTGTSGALTHAATTSLTVTGPPDFGLAAPSSQTVTPGGNTNFTIATSAANGFSDPISFTVSGLPAGASPTFNPTSVTGAGSTTLTVSAASNTQAGTYNLTVTGTSGSLAHTAATSLTVTGPPDFNLSASPSSQTVTPGGNTSYTIGTTAANGFNDAISFTVSGLPAGASPSFSPTSVTGAGSTTLSVSTASNTQAGTYDLTVTGTSGSLTHTATASLTISPDFGVSASPSAQTITPGGSNTSYTIATTTTNGFNGTVTFTASGLPTGASATFNPTSVTGAGSATMTVSAASNTQAGAYDVTVTATSGSLTHTATTSLTVTGPPDFSVSAAPSSQTITAGGNTSYTIATTAANGFNGAVTFSASGLPTGASATFNPTSVTGAGTTTLTVNTASTTAAGTYNLTITATSGSLTHTATTSLTVNGAPDFNVSAAPSSQTVAASGNTAYTVTTTAANGFNGAVTFSASGLPTGASATFNPTSVTGAGTTTLTVNTASTTAAGTYNLTITATSGSLTHTATASLTVTGPPDFSLSASPSSKTVVAGGNTTFTVSTQPTSGSNGSGSNGFNDNVSFSVTGLPSGATASFNPPSVTGSGSTNLTVTTGPTTPAGAYTLTVTATTGTLTHNSSLSLTVAAADFSLSAAPSLQTIAPGGNTAFTVGTTAANGFNDSVSFSASGLPTGASATFSPASVTGSGNTTLTVTTASTTAAGTYNVTVTATSGSLTHTATVLLTLAVGDFAVWTSPSSRTITPGANASYVVTNTALSGYSGAATFSVSGLPSGAIAMFSPWSITGGGTTVMTVNTNAATPAGNYTVTVIATCGTVVHTATAELIVADFSVSVLPASQTVIAGGNATYTIGAIAPGGFSGNLAFSVSGLPAGTAASFNPASVPVGASTTLTVTTGPATPAGAYTLTIAATSSGLTRTATAALTVNAVPVPTIGVSVSPAAGSGSTQTFALHYSDTAGAADLGSLWVWFNPGLSTAGNSNSCLLMLSRPGNLLYLYGDAGGSPRPPAPLGTATTLSNSQCTVDVGAATFTVSGADVTLTLPVTFKPAYSGSKNIYMYAGGASVTTGWQLAGSWTVPAAAPAVKALSATPSSGQAPQQTFVLHYSDSAGASDLASVWVWFNAGASSASQSHSCLLMLSRPDNMLHLYSDTGEAWLPGVPLGTGATLANSQCAVDLQAAGVSLSGTDLTLTLPVTFRPTYSGAKNIYMFGSGPSANSGWQTMGSWTVPQLRPRRVPPR